MLFENGQTFSVYPLKMVIQDTEAEQAFPAQAMFVAPKRNHKRAHDRNKLKRRMREAYRLQKQALYQDLLQKDKKVRIAFIYTARKIETYTTIQTSLKKLIEKTFVKPSGEK